MMDGHIYKMIQKIIVFILTFLAYASLHALRQGWSFSKDQISKQFSLSKVFLGWVDALYLFFYSIGMGVLSNFIHKITLKTYVVVGIVGASVSYMAWSVVYGMTSFYSPILMTVLMCINGFSQSTGWPALMGIMGNWFQKNKKGALMAVWALNANAGNIIGLVMCNLLKNNQVNWVWNFITTGLLGLAVALLIFAFLREKPSVPDQEEKLKQSVLSANEPQQQQQSKDANNTIQEGQSQLKFGIFSVLLLPRVPLYVIGYACLKGAIYGLLFWLPTFCEHKQGDIADQKGYISSMIDLGSLVGGIIIGHLSDVYQKRALFLSPLLFLCGIVMFIVSFALTDAVWQYYLAMLLIGMFVGGPYNIIGTLIAMDTGKYIKQKGAIAKVSSLIEGTAALFTAIQMIVIPYIPFDYIFYLFSTQCIVATLVLVPPLIEQIRELKQKKNPLIEQQDPSEDKSQ